MISAIISTDLPCGIIFAGEKNMLVSEIAGELHSLGLYRERTSDIFTPELADALNAYRRANRLPESDYCDPITLRLLTGIDSGGDELLLLARWCEFAHPEATEVEKFDLCRAAIRESRKLGLTVQQYLSGRANIGELLASPSASSETVKAAVLASMLET
ncbi:MAG: peptidoglycan-binding protein [Clostridiales bacterium]|nr:peptidoglycan-binding protein [Clostridiales bacterium]